MKLLTQSDTRASARLANVTNICCRRNNRWERQAGLNNLFNTIKAWRSQGTYGFPRTLQSHLDADPSVNIQFFRNVAVHLGYGTYIWL
jgi:uncharacterized protein YmfQ (DUF2313 family)